MWGKRGDEVILEELKIWDRIVELYPNVLLKLVLLKSIPCIHEIDPFIWMFEFRT